MVTQPEHDALAARVAALEQLLAELAVTLGAKAAVMRCALGSLDDPGIRRHVEENLGIFERFARTVVERMGLNTVHGAERRL